MNWTWTPLMVGLAIVWGVFTVGLILLLIYRSTLTMHEEESLYLDDASQHMQQEQTELLVKVNRLTVPVWVAGAGSGVLLLVLAGMFIYQGLNAVQSPDREGCLPRQGCHRELACASRLLDAGSRVFTKYPIPVDTPKELPPLGDCSGI